MDKRKTRFYDEADWRDSRFALPNKLIPKCVVDIADDVANTANKVDDHMDGIAGKIVSFIQQDMTKKTSSSLL